VTATDRTAAAEEAFSASLRGDLPPPGWWDLDPGRCAATATVRHALFTKVRIRFPVVRGVVHVADDPRASSVVAEIETASADSGDAVRDERIRSRDFLDVARWPAMRFQSTRVEWATGPVWIVSGDLTIRGRTNPVVLAVRHEEDGSRRPRATARFRAHAVIEREDFGLTWNQALETGGVLLGPTVDIELVVGASRQRSADSTFT
jgi:polyisoprenoid-binding protein YceI